MGNEFIGRVKDQYRKTLAQNARKLTFEDLFTIKPEDRRTIVVRPTNLSRFQTGEKYILQLEKTELSVYLSRLKIGVSVNAPSSIVSRIQELGGVTIGALDSIRHQSGLVNVIVGL
jgi:hypothetical protein